MMVNTTEPVDYSIIVPAYNEAIELPATLHALHKAIRGLALSGEIIVVDNNSTDDTAVIARRMGARVVFEPHNQISRARNAGVTAARGRYLVFVDADTRIARELLGAAIVCLEGGHVAGGGARVAFDSPVPWIGSSGLWIWNKLSEWAKLAAGSFIFVRRDIFDASEGFSEKLYAGEEIAFSMAVKRIARQRSMTFEILRNAPVKTSARKLRWHSSWRLFLLCLAHGFFPSRIRNRRACSFWYERPPQEKLSASDRDSN